MISRHLYFFAKKVRLWWGKNAWNIWNKWNTYKITELRVPTLGTAWNKMEQNTHFRPFLEQLEQIFYSLEHLIYYKSTCSICSKCSRENMPVTGENFFSEKQVNNN